jgi:AraC-like DNA-binding protein
MSSKQATSAGEGLERSCEGWIASATPRDGVELFSAWFKGAAYQTHRHDTYAIGVTDAGVQVFDYRGAKRSSLPGDVVVLHPDEPHDGRAGTGAGFGYRIVYLQPAAVSEAVRALKGRPHPLPFVRDPIVKSKALSRAITEAFESAVEPLTIDAVIATLVEGLLVAEGNRATAKSVAGGAVNRAREFLEAEQDRPVHSSELESITGLTRYELARQFRQLFGTSPYRYLLMRRVDTARKLIDADRPLAEAAQEAGFADQPHLTRIFRSTFGMTPGKYRALKIRGAVSR